MENPTYNSISPINKQQWKEDPLFATLDDHWNKILYFTIAQDPQDKTLGLINFLQANKHKVRPILDDFCGDWKNNFMTGLFHVFEFKWNNGIANSDDQ